VEADLDPVELTRRLIGIDSVNPALVPGGAGEATIAGHCAAWLGRHGFGCRLLEHGPGRVSVLAVAPGSGGGRSLMLNGHLDTVALSSYDGDGLDPVLADGVVRGRGAYDMKSGLAAAMVAAATATRSPHRGDVVVALVADEEHASTGTEEVLRHIRTDAAVVAEPSGLDLVVAHRGFVWAEVTVHGVAAHGSRPDLGVDAITKTGRVLTGLERLGSDLAARPPHPLLGTGSVHAGTIAGGVEASSYPDRCTVVVERRTLPGEDGATVERELRGLLDGIAASDRSFRYDLAISFERQPFAADPESAVAATLAAAHEATTGAPPRRRGEPFWTDCALLHDAGIDTVLHGVDGGGAHAAEEWVTVESLHALTRTLAATVAAYTA
jgi:acetylornithine deacetylase